MSLALLKKAALTAILLGFAAAPLLHAQTYPVHAVRVLVPFPAGGPLDFLARAIGQKLAAAPEWGQPLVIDNRPGAGGNLGAQAAAKAAPDGYTVLLTVDTVLTANPSLYRKLPFDPDKDFRAISTLATFDLALVVPESIPARNVEEFITLVRQGSMTYASGGSGNPGQLVMELFLHAANARMIHVPYKGNAPAIAGLLGGDVQAAFVALPGVVAHVRARKLRALAVSGGSRSTLLPDVRTISEAGHGSAQAEFAFVALAPAGTPDAAIRALHGGMVKAVQAPDIRDALEKQGIAALGSTPEHATARMRAERQKWSRVIQALDLRVD